MNPRYPTILVLMATLLAAPGCLERKESIQVTSDGRVTIELKYTGKEKEWQTTDALPSRESGWDMTYQNKEVGGDEERVGTASRNFAAGEELASTYAPEGHPKANVALSFPTTLRVEQRDGARYFHFRRVYSPRPWAFVRYWQDIAVDADIKRLAEKPAAELTHEERVRMLKAFGSGEALRQAEFLQAAVQQALPSLPPDRWLVARKKLLEVYEEIDFDRLVSALEALPEETRDQRLEEESESILKQARDAMNKALRSEGGLSDSQLATFEKAHERVRLQYEVTEQTGGHGFEISLHMPGRVVAHNADKVDDDGTAVWEFTGEAFRDRPFEILMTSRVQDE